jgi:hypothetical protein
MRAMTWRAGQVLVANASARCLSERACGVADLLGRPFDQHGGIGDGVYQAHAARGFSAQRTSTEDQIQRCRSADQGRQTHGTAPARVNAEFDLRQAQPGLVGTRGDPPAASQCKFQPPAHAEAVDGGDGRAAQRREPVEHCVPSLDCGERGFGVGVIFEFVNIRAGNETVILALNG